MRGWDSSSLLPFVKSLVVHDLASTAPHDVPASVSSPPSHKPINPRILIQVLALFLCQPSELDAHKKIHLTLCKNQTIGFFITVGLCVKAMS